MQILMVGDIHGDLSFAVRACHVAKELGISQIIQLGDFGIWDHTEKGVYFLDELDKHSEDVNVSWLFVPGNHENYDSLEEHALNDPTTAEDFVVIRDRILYTRKVNKWTWAGKTFKVVGGAYSIDKKYRTPGTSWWPQEQLTDDELALAVDMGHVDILLTHDCPTWADFGMRLKEDLESQMHRQKMNEVYSATLPKIWFHGHYHTYMEYESRGTRVYGLECNDNAMYHTTSMDDMYKGFKNMVIFDTDTMRIEHPSL